MSLPPKTERAAVHAPWQKEFFKNAKVFCEYGGMSEKEANALLIEFLHRSSKTPPPAVLESFRDVSALDRVGVYTPKDVNTRDFMMRFFKPLFQNFEVKGLENLTQITPLFEKFPLVLVANHLSHLDTAVIYYLLYQAGGDARKLADNLVFIAGRLAFEPDFTRLGVRMIDTLLVCSQKDMQENPGMADLMTRINMRTFRQSQKLQQEGKVIAVFPEGTRSRTGQLLKFVSTSFHFINNKIIIPFSLEGTEGVVPPGSFLFSAPHGKVVLGRPILLGSLPNPMMEALPDYVEQFSAPKSANKKSFLTDALAVLVGSQLHHHRHGSYRNLYSGEKNDVSKNILIRSPEKPRERIGIIGHSAYSTAQAVVFAGKETAIKIYIQDAQKAQDFNQSRSDLDFYPVFKLPPNIEFTADPEDLRESSLFIQGVRPWEIDLYYEKIKNIILEYPQAPVLSITKGFTGVMPGLILESLHDRYGIPKDRMAVLAGANYPDQIMERKTAGFEIASFNTLLIERLLPFLNNSYIFTQPAINRDDVRGVQLGGALKNIYAIAVGLIDGYYHITLGGNNDNSLFHLSNRFFNEMTCLGESLGGRKSTFQGLSGVSDFMLSCFAQDARDRQFGYDFIHQRCKPELISRGLIGINFLPQIMKLDPEKYPAASYTYEVIVNLQNPQDMMPEMIQRLH